MWTSSVQATPLFGMNPPEVVVKKESQQDQLDTNILGCRNALLRTLLIPTSTSDSMVTRTNSKRSPLLDLIPSPSEWKFIGRVLNFGNRKCAVRNNSSSKNENAQLNAMCSTLEYVFVCQIDTSQQDSKTQQMLSLSNINIDGREARFGEIVNDLNLGERLEREWVTIPDVRACLVDEKANELRLDKKFKAIAINILNLQTESSLKQDLLVKVDRHKEIFIVDDTTPAATSVLSLLGDDRSVIY